MIATDEGHTIALMSDGSVKACGWNAYGQIGDGTTTDRYRPIKVLQSS
ncbi:RCC1 domain-containing protein [Streptomyces sp. NPDC048479]